MRRGFTFIEVMVVLFVILALAAIVVPQIANRAGQATETAVISSVASLTEAIGQFKADTRRYPGQLQWLANTAGTPTDICGDVIAAGLLSRWSGPYVQRQIPTSGLPAGDATIQNALERADPATTTVSNLIVKAAGVTQSQAESLDAEFDGVVDLNSGAIQWTTPDTLLYYYPIRGC